MGLAKITSGAVTGINAYSVEIETDVSRSGDPQIVVVGLPDAAVKESQYRVSTAITNSGYEPFRGRITVNLAPADVRKEGPIFDLPIAIGILLASEEVSLDPKKSTPMNLAEVAVLGELSLAGEVRRVRGILPIAMELKNSGIKNLLVPADNACEAAVIEDINVYPVKTLRHAAQIICGESSTAPVKSDINELRIHTNRDANLPDFAEVKGQELAKRAVEIAVAGGHNILMVGPPGTGKSMLARRIISILPPMSSEEILEVTKIHSVAGTLSSENPLMFERPYRSPHHTVSDAGLLGGGAHPLPGEVTLAHLGVLFLDELPEFPRGVLEVLRQPLEDGFVTISRAAGSFTFPSRFIFVAAMNPCPCGYAGDAYRECRCTRTQVQNYRNKISGPLLDRIDIHIQVPATNFRDLQSIPEGDDSEKMRNTVLRAQMVQQNRFKDNRKIRNNSYMGRRDIERYCRLGEESREVLNFAINELHFSPRAHDRILKVARTIADIGNSEDILPEHLHEALQYRSLDRTLWT